MAYKKCPNPDCNCNVTSKVGNGAVVCKECGWHSEDVPELAEQSSRPWLGGCMFVFFGLVAALSFMAAFADNDTLSDQNFVPALIGLIASLIALYGQKLFWGNWKSFFIFLLLMLLGGAIAMMLSATGDSRREFFDR